MLSDFLHCKVTSVSKNLKCKVKGHFLHTLRIVTFWRCEQNKDNAIDIIRAMDSKEPTSRVGTMEQSNCRQYGFYLNKHSEKHPSENCRFQKDTFYESGWFGR